MTTSKGLRETLASAGVSAWQPDHRPCHRCGIIREARKRTMLCVDCKDTLNPAEKRAWR